MDKQSLSTVKNDLARRIDAGASYKKAGDEIGVNPGIVWKLLNEPDYDPMPATLHKLGLRAGPPRVRITAQVPDDWRDAVREAAAAEGQSMADWLRDLIARELDLCD